jgi:hypothetical protein
MGVVELELKVMVYVLIFPIVSMVEVDYLLEPNKNVVVVVVVPMQLLDDE